LSRSKCNIVGSRPCACYNAAQEMGDISVVVRLTLIANLLSASLARYGRWHRPSIYISVIISCHQIV